MTSALAQQRQADLVLAAYDYLNIKIVPRWRDQQVVVVEGEVEFPGEYPIRQGEQLSSLIARAGGLTDQAFPAGAVFTRENLREQQAEQLERFAQNIEADLASMALSDPGQSEAITTGQTLVSRLRATEAVGRLVIDLAGLVAGDSSKDIRLNDGDRLVVPPTTQEILVIGEVQNSTSHLYEAGLTREDYIDRSGGTTSRADERRIHVVRASGEVVMESGRRWFRRSGSGLQAGDTVVVPLDTDRVRPLVAWEGITQVLYNIAIAFSVIDRI